jgi:Fic family protein
LEYFLNGIARMSEDALGRAARINALLSNWRVAAAGDGTNTPMLLLDLLAANPFVTVNHVAEKLGIAFTTAQRAIAKLEKLKIISEVSEAKRDRVYCAKAILAILEEPAHLTPSGEF